MRLEINRRAAWANGPDRWNLDDADTGHRLGYIAPDHNGGWTAHVAGRDTVEGTWLEQSDALKAARRAIEAKEARFDRWLENHPGTAPDETSRPPIAFQRDIRIMASQETDDYRLVHEGWDVGSVGRDGDAWTVTDAYGRPRSHASLYEALDQAVLRADRWLEENDPQSREDRIVDEWHDWDVTTEQLESHRPTAHEIVRQNIGFQRTMRTRLDAAGMEHAIVRSIDGPTILAAPYERDVATIIELDDGRRIIASATDRNERIRTVIGETDHGDVIREHDLNGRPIDGGEAIDIAMDIIGHPRSRVNELKDRLEELAPYATPGPETPDRTMKAKEYQETLREYQLARDGFRPWPYARPNECMLDGTRISFRGSVQEPGSMWLLDVDGETMCRIRLRQDRRFEVYDDANGNPIGAYRYHDDALHAAAEHVHQQLRARLTPEELAQATRESLCAQAKENLARFGAPTPSDLRVLTSLAERCRSIPQNVWEQRDRVLDAAAADPQLVGKELGGVATLCLRPTALDAVEIEFEDGTTVKAYSDELRFDRENIPEGWHAYSVRMDDEGGFDPVTVERRVWVNHGYDILTREDLDQRIADHDGWLPIKDDGWSFTSGKPLVLSPTIRAKDYWEKSVEKLVDVLDEDARPLAETRKESRSEPDKDKPQHQHHHTR